MNSDERRAEITRLIREELIDEGNDPDLITHWVCVVGLRDAVADGDGGPYALSLEMDREMPSYVELGLLEHRLMMMRAMAVRVVNRAFGEDDDDGH